MRICLLAEGSYPYVVGGVSSWVQMLMEGLPEHEFIVYSIGAEAKDRGQFKYKLPANCIRVEESFLDEILSLRSADMSEGILTPDEQQTLYDLVRGERDVPLYRLAEIFHHGRWRSPLTVFMSSDFFDIIARVYRKEYNNLPFTDFFWTMRSMLLPLFYLMQQKLPEADVYHSVATGYCGVIGGLAATMYQKPFMITEHGIYSREREAEIIKSDWAKTDFKAVWIKYFYYLARLSYHAAGQLYTLFEHNGKIAADLGCAPEKINIVPNGVHMERFTHIPELMDHGGPITIGAVVRVVPIKDILTLLRAFAVVRRELPDAQLVIMGGLEEDPDYVAVCHRTIRMLGLENVTFTGSVPVAEYLPKMDIMVLSSISEGQPLAVLEGFSAHRPYVTTDVGCCRELIYGDRNDTLGTAGAVVAPMDYEAMAHEILRLARSYELRRSMAEIGFARTKAHYTYEQFIASYQQAYERAAKEGANGRRRI